MRAAVAFTEFCGLVPELHEAGRKGTTLGEVVRCLSEAIDEELAEANPPNAAHLLKTRGQFHLPEFGAYLAGRLRLM